MKKKLTAALLTLCMVISLLPLSALAASWTAKLGGEAVTVTEDENGEITVTKDGETNPISYYSFKKVTTGEVDTFHYYATGDVYVGTLTDVVAVAEDNEKIVSAEVSGGEATANVEISEDEAASMVEAGAEEGTVKVTVNTENATTVNVSLPSELLSAAAQADAIKTVTVTTEVAVVALPTSVLGQQTVTLTMTKMTTTTTILGGVSLSLGKVDTFDVPVAVTINVTTTVTNPIVAYRNDSGKLFRVRQDAPSNGAFTFFTRHFSDFVVVDPANASIDPVTMTNKGEGNRHTFALEQDETLVTALKSSTGSFNYVWSSPKAAEMGESTYDASVTAPAAELANLWAVIGDPAVNADGTPNVDAENIIGIPADIEVDE